MIRYWVASTLAVAAMVLLVTTTAIPWWWTSVAMVGGALLLVVGAMVQEWLEVERQRGPDCGLGGGEVVQCQDGPREAEDGGHDDQGDG